MAIEFAGWRIRELTCGRLLPRVLHLLVAFIEMKGATKGVFRGDFGRSQFRQPAQQHIDFHNGSDIFGSRLPGTPQQTREGARPGINEDAARRYVLLPG